MRGIPNAGDMIGRYRITRFIARGGMGSVYEADDTQLGRPVAIKILVPELSDEPELKARFADEAKVLAGLDSPHIIKLFDHGVHEGQLYLVTQLVRGDDLGTLLQRGALPVSVGLDLVAQVASALSDAHGAGLLHRDVKPSNILVVERGDGDLFAYLIDFGIARTEDAGHTSTGIVVGTVAYLAPERHGGAPASVTTDVYALGCLLWAVLTGRSPYAQSGGSVVSVAIAHMQQPVPVYDGPGPTAAINELLRRSMAKDPAERYPTASAMRAALREVQRAVDGTGPVPVAGRAAGPDDATESLPGPAAAPAHAPPTVVVTPTSAQPGARAPRPRRRGPALLAAAAVLAVLVGGGVAAVVLTGGDDPAPTATDDTSTSATSAVPATGVPTTAVSTAPSEPVTTTSEAPAVVTLGSLFPQSESSFCTIRRDLAVSEKIEVRECEGSGYLIRYSEWRDVETSFAHYEEEKADEAPWTVGGERLGTSWSTDDAGGERTFQWSAAFADLPFSVSVESATEDGRIRGIDAVEGRLAAS